MRGKRVHLLSQCSVNNCIIERLGAHLSLEAVTDFRTGPHICKVPQERTPPHEITFAGSSVVGTGHDRQRLLHIHYPYSDGEFSPVTVENLGPEQICKIGLYYVIQAVFGQKTVGDDAVAPEQGISLLELKRV